MKILVGQQVFGFLSVHAPQGCLKDAVKDLFYDQLRAIPASVSLIPCGECNDRGGSTGSGYKEVHGSRGYERVLEYASAYDLLICNMYPRNVTVTSLHTVVEEPGFKNVKNKHLGMPPF